MIKKIAIIAAILFAFAHGASAQRWSVSTNLVDWATIGTINLEGSASLAQRVSVQAGFKYNPWTFRADDPDKQFQLRQKTYYAGVRWWPWHVFSGWWMSAYGQYREYNRGGLLSRETEEGDAFGGGVSGGYALMLSESLNVEFGVGLWGGVKDYTRYSCPRCGKILDEGRKAFVEPDDIRISFVFIF